MAVKLPVFLGNKNRQTNRLTDRPTDREVFLLMIQGGGVSKPALEI